MNFAMGLQLRRTRFVLLIAAAMVILAAPNLTRAQGTLEFRVLASGKTDKAAIDALKSGLKEGKAKLEELKKAKKAPNLLEPAAAEPPASTAPTDAIASALGVPSSLVDALALAYLAGKKSPTTTAPVVAKVEPFWWLKITEADLQRLGIRMKSALKIDKTVVEKLEKAKTDGEIYVNDANNVVVYSYDSPDKKSVEYFLLARPKDAAVAVGGKDVKNVRSLANDNLGAVQISLDEEGAKKFKTFTTNNKGNYVALVINQQAVFTFKVGDPIVDGEMEISGRMSRENAEMIAAKIKSCKTP